MTRYWKSPARRSARCPGMVDVQHSRMSEVCLVMNGVCVESRVWLMVACQGQHFDASRLNSLTRIGTLYTIPEALVNRIRSNSSRAVR